MPAQPSAHAMPRWAYLALALACAGMGLWSSVVTLQFFEHGAAALENDPALQALAVGAAVLFVFGEMSACVLAALMTGSQFKARRWILYGLAAVILGIEIFTISSVQMASVAGASMTQTSVSDSVADLQKQIARVEANGAEYTATAASLRGADQLKKATAYADKATAEQAKATELYARLDASRKAKRPTLSGLLGEKPAMYYAIARGVLVVLSGVVFFGTAGALLHAARGGALSTDQQILELLQEIRSGAAPATRAEIVAPVAPALPIAPPPMPVTMQVQAAPVAPATAAPVQAATQAPFTFLGFKQAPAVPISATPATSPASFKPVGTVAPSGFSFSTKATMAGAGALAALTTAPITHAAPAPVHEKAPAVPAERVNDDISKRINDDTPAPMKTGVSAPVNGDVLTSPERVNDDISKRVNDDTPEAPTKARKARVARDGAVMDSGTGPLDGFRYRRAVAGVKAGKIQTTYAGLYEGVGVTAPTAKRFLEAMADAGVVMRKGTRYFLAEKYQAKLVKKGGAA